MLVTDLCHTISLSIRPLEPEGIFASSKTFLVDISHDFMNETIEV